MGDKQAAVTQAVNELPVSICNTDVCDTILIKIATYDIF